MIAQFAFRLICGISMAWCVAPRREITSGFFRIQMLVALGLAVLGLLTARQTDELVDGGRLLGAGAIQLLAGAIAATAFLGSILWTLERRRGGTIAGFGVAGLSLTVLLGSLPDQVWSGSASAAILWVASETAAAWLLGSVVAAMLLGHWYLTAPMMSLSPLLWLNRFLGLAVLLRIALSVTAWSLAPVPVEGGAQGIWMVLRWVAGLIAPLALCLMVGRILRYRNTQSATGVLFAATILTFIGESAAALLSRELQWPM